MTEHVTRTHGTIASLHKGYGFIAADSGERAFFYCNALDSFGPAFDELGLGQRVVFTLCAGPKGPRGVDVRVVE